jgi:hypothetical protein
MNENVSWYEKERLLLKDGQYVFSSVNLTIGAEHRDFIETK